MSEVFYRNNDLGEGYNSLNKYKSIKEFRDARKKFKKKHKLNEFSVSNNGSLKIKQSERKMALLYALAIDFPYDNQEVGENLTQELNQILPESNINPYGGITDQYTQSVDFEGKTPDKLNYGQEKDYPNDISELTEEDMDKLLNSAEPPFLGMDDTTDSREDLETNIPSGESRHGKTYTGNRTYEKTPY